MVSAPAIASVAGGNSSRPLPSPISGYQGVYPSSSTFTTDALDRALHNVQHGAFGRHGLVVPSPGDSINNCQQLSRIGIHYPYLEPIAKGYKNHHEDSLGRDGDEVFERECGYWAILGRCDCGRTYAKKLVCGREWCPKCRDVTEGRRFARWLPKAQQMRVMGYMVITFPPEVRPHSKKELRRLRRGIIRGLKRLGVKRGLSRWHFFGESGGKWHPHLNLLLDCGRISPALLNRIKSMIARIAGCRMCVVNYRYTRVVSRKVHMLKYVCRNTFLDKSWDPWMASGLYGFNNCHSWGTWDDPAVWSLEDERYPKKGSHLPSQGICMDCGGDIHWRGGKNNVFPSCLLGVWGFEDVGDGYYRGGIWGVEFWDSS